MGYRVLYINKNNLLYKAYIRLYIEGYSICKHSLAAFSSRIGRKLGISARRAYPVLHGFFGKSEPFTEKIAPIVVYRSSC